MAEAPRPTPAMLATAWRAFRGDRPGMMLGSGPGFVEALKAAMTLDPRVAELEADARKWRLVRRCTICGTPLGEPNRLWSADCGGDCLACMADCGDPDAIEALKPYVPKRQETRDA